MGSADRRDEVIRKKSAREKYREKRRGDGRRREREKENC
jgi:hypothetical protein